MAASRIDSQRVEAIRHLYGALVACRKAVLESAAANNLGIKPHQDAIAMYERWAQILREKSETLENIYMHPGDFLF